MKLARLNIRKKIIYGSSILLLLVSFTAFMMYGIVLQVERKVVLVEVIDDFLKTTLELRRYEKNYFLYSQKKDFDDALFFWQTLKELLDRHIAELNRLVHPSHIQNVQQSMSAYRDDLLRLESLTGSEKNAVFTLRLHDEIRRNGKLLTDFAEQTVLAERASIKTLLHTTRSIQVVSALALVLLSTAMAIVLGRKVLSSLRLLEGYTRKISQGEMLDPPKGVVEEEINFLLRAFQRMNRELQARQRQLVQSEKLAAMGTLLAGVAHELNNPLSNISTSAQILTEEIDRDDSAFKINLLSQIEVQTDKARDIVRTLLEFSRIKDFHKEDINLKQLMDETMRLIKGQLPKDVQIGIDIPENIAIRVDKQRMQQVFLNLIKNSLDALGGAVSPGHIWVTAQKSLSQHGSVVEILVEDDGPGIPPKVKEKIFDPFFTTKDVGKGSGLGLYIVHDIIESHGGDITVESSPGAGTTFIIWLRDEAGAEK